MQHAAARGAEQHAEVHLPILGGSAMGKSKVIARSHFGIFTKPAGHCGGQTHRITHNARLTVSSRLPGLSVNLAVFVLL